MIAELKAPFPYFGGKRRVAEVVWARLGDTPNYVEPFAGSAAMLLARPTDHTGSIETINDACGYVANFWRALQADPEAVAYHADWPVNENDLHARHAWLSQHLDRLGPQLEGDPDWYDSKIAGWWVWGISCWIGGGFCYTNGPWHSVDGVLVNDGDAGRGVHRQRPHLGDAGQGIHRKLPHLGDYMQQLADRLRRVRVCCGDWSRVVTPSVTTKHGTTAVFLDPPYTVADRFDLYGKECRNVGRDVHAWAMEHGDNSEFRIVLCGYEGEYEIPDTWHTHKWSGKGMESPGQRGDMNRHKERIWFSPHCLRPDGGHRQRNLFDEVMT